MVITSASSALWLDTATANACRVVAGLPLALRLALDAQQAGVNAIVVSDEATDVRRVLADSRLRVPVIANAPRGAVVLRVPANFVVHRALLKRVLESGAARPSELADSNERVSPRAYDLTSERGAAGGPYGFETLAVTDAASAREAERRLFRALRKTQDGWTSRYLNRHISLFISRGLVRTPVRPNQLSVGILAIGLGGAVFAARGGYGNLLFGALLFQLQSVLDGCDGELSRITHRGSLTGEWLDTIGDDLTNYAFFAAAAGGLYRSSHELLYVLAGAVTVVAGAIGSGLEYRYLMKIGSGDLLKYPLSQVGEAKGSLAFLQPLFKRDTFVFMTLCAAALSLLGPMLCLFAGGAVGIMVSVIRTERRLQREGRTRGAAS